MAERTIKNCSKITVSDEASEITQEFAKHKNEVANTYAIRKDNIINIVVANLAGTVSIKQKSLNSISSFTAFAISEQEQSIGLMICLQFSDNKCQLWTTEKTTLDL